MAVPVLKIPTKVKKSTIERMEFIADSIVKKHVADSLSFIDRERGTITAAVVSPPIMDANINDGRMSHFSMKIPKAAISAMLDKT